MPYIISRFGASWAAGTALPILGMQQPVGLGAVASTIVQLPGGNSWDSLGSAQTRPHSQVITIHGGYVAASAAALTTYIDAMRALVGVRSYLWATPDSGSTTRWRLARCLDVRATAKPGFPRWIGVDMDFELAAGGWNGAAHSESTALATGNDAIETTNAGNAIVTNAIITITAQTTAITELSFYVTGLLHWHYTGSITATKSLIVDCGTRKVTNDGTGDFANFVLQSDHADNDWLPIQSGVNSIQVERTGGGATSAVVLAYNDGWA